MNFLKNVVKEQVFYTFLVPLIICGVLLVLSMIQFNKTSEIEQQWSNYIESIDRKEVSISELKSTIGYGGLIHSFKNYILRENRSQYLSFGKHYAKVKTILTDLYSSGISEKERLHLESIERTFDEYNAKIKLAKSKINTQMNAEEVDQLVKVDDTNALNSFKWLEDNQKSLKAIATSQMLELVERSKYLVIFSFILGIFFISSISVYASRKLLHHKAKAENLANLKSSFLANMSHEIRTPLNGIIGFSNVLIDQDLPKDSEEYVRLIQSSSDILLTVINDILDFSKIEAGKLHLEKLSFNVEDVVKNTIALFSPLVRFKSISISYDIDPSIPIALISDPSRIKQILSNLISNSVKFTKNGHIDVTVKNAGNGRVVFTVKDTGVGMSEEAQKRIFNAFEQEDLSTSRLHGGTGLGLAISKNLVNMLGGSIWVESKKDEGSSFSFTIPLAEGRIQTEVRNSDFNITNTNSELQILVAEDNLINQ
ncbi:MAG: ATP-binding protein, partial [Bacteriovoracaceae bacterium]|nr:ATP-binding protein [Bacteriovoracaceae bacterium]